MVGKKTFKKTHLEGILKTSHLLPLPLAVTRYLALNTSETASLQTTLLKYI